MNQISEPPFPPQDERQSEAPDDPCVAQRRRRAARWLGVATLLIVLCMVGWGSWAHIAQTAAARQALQTQQDAVPLVRTQDVKAETGQRYVDLPGTLQAFDAATLYTRATGYIAKRNVDIGSQVRKGDVLAVIAAPDLDQQLAQARAQLAQMKAALAQAQAGRSLADVTNQRTSRLVAEGWNSRQQGDQDRTNLLSQSAAVRVAAANLLAQQAQVNRLTELTGFERVVAPFDGIITGREIDAGSLVSADQNSGSPLFALARSDVLRVQVYVPQEYVFALKDGQDATVTIPELPDHVFHGTVARNAGALVTQTRTLLAEIDVPNPDKLLSPGLYAIVHLQQPRARPVVVIPTEAVIFNKDGLSAAVVDHGTAAVRHLAVAADNGATLEISDGLKPGDKVILSPPVDLTPGMKVRLN